jgi:NAD(P)H-dependent FMN reductase
MPNLHVVITSTRSTRVGPAFAEWILERARAHGGFEVKLVDLKEVNLPVFDEPRHPRLKQYEHAHTKAWSETVSAADAFVFVTPEYNFSGPPSLVNALTYLSQEWAYKPAGFVSYGGASGGLRAVESLKGQMTALKLVPLTESVAVPMFTQHLKDGKFVGGEGFDKSATGMLTELHRWTTALKSLR